MARSSALGRGLRDLPRPTRSASLLLLLAMILELLGRLIHSTGVTIAAAAAVGAVISDAFLTPSTNLGTIRRRAPRRTTAGIGVPVRLTITPRARKWTRARRTVAVIDCTPGFEPSRVITPRLARGQYAEAVVSAVPPARGLFNDAPRLHIEAVSPLGGFIRRRTIRGEPELLVVHPRPALPLRLPDAVEGAARGTTTARRNGAGHDVFGVREWRSGDPASAVHWRSSARRGHLVVLEREQPGRPALVIAVDAGSGDEPWEAMLARVAATATEAVRAGQAVTLVHGESGTGLPTPGRALDVFAGLSAATTLGADALRETLRRLRPGATLLYFGADPLPADLAHAARTAGVKSVVTVTGDPAQAGGEVRHRTRHLRSRGRR